MTALTFSSKIEQFFGSRPRDGTQQGALWHRRAEIEKRLSQLLAARSQNICIDGPTGSGKSSLAITVLSKIGQRYIWIPVINNMLWPDFCEDIVIKALNATFDLQKRKRGSVFVQLNSNKPLTADEVVNPLKFLGRIAIGANDAKEEIATLRRISRDWKISDVEEFVSTNELCLLVDDFEKAPDSLIQVIADLCKRLTIQSAPKCIIIGTGETFARLYRADEGLDGRLA